MSHTKNGGGYWCVQLTLNGVGKAIPVHILLALTFIGPRPEGYLVRHRDDNKDNNSLSNLCYGTESDNHYDMVNNGNHLHARKVICSRGHELAEPNLIKHNQHRACLACNRTTTTASNHRRRLGITYSESELQGISDAKYATIILRG